MPKTGSYGVNAKNSNILSTLPANDKAVLVSVRNHQVVTTSLRVAEYFGKKHCDVLRAINLLESSELFRQRNFALSCYTKKNGNVRKSYPMYYLTRDGFTLLAMGFTGKIAARFKEAYIEAFNEMERTLRENESTEYAKAILKERIAEFNKRMKEGVAEGRKRHGDGYGGRGDMMPWLPFYERMSFEENPTRPEGGGARRDAEVPPQAIRRDIPADRILIFNHSEAIHVGSLGLVLSKI